MFDHLWFVMARDGCSNHVNFPSSPVDSQVILCQPRVSQDDIVSFPKVQHKEILSHIPPINPEMELDLMANHPSGVTCSASILGVHWLVEFLWWPFYSSSHMEDNTTDCFPTVNQSSGFSDFSIFHLVKSHRDSDCSSRCCYKYGLNVCGKR